MAKHSERIKHLLNEGWTYNEIIDEVGCSKAVISYHAARLRKGRGPREKYDWKMIQVYYDEGHTYIECQEEFGFHRGTWARAKRRGLIKTRPRLARPKPGSAEYKARHSTYMLALYHRVRQEMLKVLGGRCANCGTTERLEIDHIDPKKKTMPVDQMTSAAESRRSVELLNCQVLCRSCHAVKTLKDNGKKPAKGTHGTLSAYRYCRCAACRKAKSDHYKKQRAHPR